MRLGQIRKVQNDLYQIRFGQMEVISACAMLDLLATCRIGLGKLRAVLNCVKFIGPCPGKQTDIISSCQLTP